MARKLIEGVVERMARASIRLCKETEASLACVTPEILRKPVSHWKPEIIGSSIGLALITRGVAAQTQGGSAVCSTSLSWMIPTGLSLIFIILFGAGLYRSGIGLLNAGSTNQSSHQQGRDSISNAVIYNLAPALFVPGLIQYYINSKGINWLSCVDLGSVGLTVMPMDVVALLI